MREAVAAAAAVLELPCGAAYCSPEVRKKAKSSYEGQVGAWILHRRFMSNGVVIRPG